MYSAVRRALMHVRARRNGGAAALLCVSVSACTGGMLRSPQSLHVDCVSAAVVGLSWTSQGRTAAPFKIYRNGELIGTTQDTESMDTTVTGSASYTYVIGATDVAGRVALSEPLTLNTPPPGPQGDAPYCASPLIGAMRWDWSHGYRAAEGSDLWSVTWGSDGNVYAFFGDGGGFGGDDLLGRASFGIARISGRPPLTTADGHNIYGGFHASHASTLNGKARSILAVGRDFYAIAGIYRPTDPKFRPHQLISGAPSHVELLYSRNGAVDWRDSGWTFCRSDVPSEAQPDEVFCPAGFVNAGRAAHGAPDGFVYLFGSSPLADRRASQFAAAARTYLARVRPVSLLKRSDYEYFAGFDAASRPRWSADAALMQPVFVDRNAPQTGCNGLCMMSSSLEEAVYDVGLKRYIGVAQGDTLAQTSFYEAPHPWGPWKTISYNNIVPTDGSGGWGELGAAAGESLGVHPINAWTSPDGRTLWMAYSSDGIAPSSAKFPPPGSKLDAFNVVRVDLAKR